MKPLHPASGKERGFTMVEMLIAVFIGMIVMALIVSAYWSQTQTSKNQKMAVQMQQNIRAGLFFMQRDIVMAGFSDDPANPSSGTVTDATSTLFEFTFADPICDEDNINNNAITGDTNVDEDFEKDGIDNNGDGETDEMNELETIRFDLAGNQIHRRMIEDATGNIRQDEVIANDIENLEFVYTLTNGTTTTSPAAGQYNNISKVGISILARTEFDTVTGALDEELYTTLSGTVWGPYNDNYRRELVTTTVLCRNMVR